MAVWSYFYPDVMVCAPSCPQPLVDQSIRRACVNFFQRTRAWRIWLDSIAANASNQYDFDTPSESEIVKVEKATVDGTPYGVITPNELDKDPTLFQASAGQGLVSDDLRSYRFIVPLSVGQSIQAYVSLKPTATAQGLPDALASDFYDQICDGAKARILALPKTDFIDLPMAGAYAQRFEAAINSIAVQSWRGRTLNVARQRMKWM